MSSDGLSLSILVVEDENLLRWIIRRKLEDSGYKVLDAATCREALDISSRNQIDLLISDFRLDDGFGDDLARRIDKSRGDTALLLMTGESEGLSGEDFGGMDLLGIMTKPVNLDGLTELIKFWDKTRVRSERKEYVAGIFGVFRVESLAEVARVIDGSSDSVAFEIRGGSFGDGDDLIDLLQDKVAPGRRLCVVAGARTSLIEGCRRAGVEVVVSRDDLEVLSRRMVSGAERTAVLSLTGQDDYS